MLPYEEENIEIIKRHFAKYIDAGYKVIKTGLEVMQAWQDQGQPNTMASEAVVLLTQTVYRRYRSIIALCEMGHLADADVLARSLYESFLSARFVLILQLPKSAWSPELQSEFKTVTNLSGADTLTRFTDMDFRASVYFACDATSLEKLHSKQVNNQFVVDEESARNVSMMIDEANRAIGEPWVNRLRRKGMYLGFSSVKCLSEYCDMKEYYLGPYHLQSHKSHGRGALALLGGENADLIPALIRLSGGKVGQLMEDLNKAFHLNLERKIGDSADRFDKATE